MMYLFLIKNIQVEKLKNFKIEKKDVKCLLAKKWFNIKNVFLQWNTIKQQNQVSQSSLF